MPWATNAELPDHVKGVLPPAAQTRFRNVANECLNHGDTDKVAMMDAWTAVKQGWEKGSGGQWVRKAADLIEKAAPRTLYVCRYVKNGADIIKWAKDQGFKTTVPADELHVTVAFSRQPVDWMKASASYYGPSDEKGNFKIPPGGPRLVEPLGPNGAVVLLFGSSELTWRHEAIRRDTGASWDWSGYQPHITITYDGKDVDVSKIEPYQGEIVLGPEIFSEVNDSYTNDLVEKYAPLYDQMIAKFAAVNPDVRVVKVDPGLGLVFGWAIVCKHQGQDYYDLNRGQDGRPLPEHIPEGAMLEAASDFMEHSRVAKDMHTGEQQGQVVFAFPMTEDVAKSLNINTNGTTGLLIAMKPSPAMLEKFKSGEFTGFSIGGSRKKVSVEVEPSEV